MSSHGQTGAMRRSGSDLVALVLLGLAVATLALTLVELLMRGAPWSESGYHRTKAAQTIPSGGRACGPGRSSGLTWDGSPDCA